MARSEAYVAKTIRVFVSYSHRNRKTAGRIKAELEEYGLKVFLAHEDIAPSRQWQETILADLKSCDVFLPLLTKEFQNSDWVDQESGIAIVREKLIVPLKVSIDPYGFLGRYQALKFKRREYRKSCRSILDTIAEKDDFSQAVRDCIIQSFLRSDSYDQANRRSRLLDEFKPYNKKQLNEIARGSARNGQIYRGFTAQPIVSRLIRANSSKIDKAVRAEFERRISG